MALTIPTTLTPIQLVLIVFIVYLLYSFIPSRSISGSSSSSDAALPTTAAAGEYNWRPAAHPTSYLWSSFTPESLSKYDGSSTAPDGRILFALRRKVYDVTSGKKFYGPGGSYDIFAGRDASRGMAKQSFEPEMLSSLSDPIDPLLDLTKSEWDNLRDWEDTFTNKYILCGDLVQSL